MNGIDLLKKIKKINPSIDVIIITALGEVESYLEAMHLGAIEYLNKPIGKDVLIKVVMNTLTRKMELIDLDIEDACEL